MENQKELLDSIVLHLRELNRIIDKLSAKTPLEGRSDAKRLVSRSKITLKKVEDLAELPPAPKPNI